ncbi:MAG: hypothetical protein R3B72_07820 [Polyangiaceae bacterium]
MNTPRRSGLAALLLLLLLAPACATNECEDATDVLVECGLVDEGGSNIASESCEGTRPCQAACIQAAPCDQLTAYFESLDVNNAFGDCMMACDDGGDAPTS